MRKDAIRNRQRLLDAADAMFREHGIEVGVGEIACAAGVGRGTLFRNFHNKDALIAAVVATRMRAAVDVGRQMLAQDSGNPELTFTFVAGMTMQQEANRALLQAMTDELLFSIPEFRETHAEMMDLLTEMLERGKQAGSIRPEATANDLMMLVKGLCMNPAADLPLSEEALLRHLDLVRAALTTPEYARPLRGVPATLPV